MGVMTSSRTDAQLVTYADRISEALRDIDRMAGDLKPEGHPDYDTTLILAKLRRGRSPR